MKYRMVWKQRNGTWKVRIYIGCNHVAQAYGLWELDFPHDAHAKIRPRFKPVVTCCGEDLVCGHFTNTCQRCGASFTMNGHKRARCNLWREDSGKRYTHGVGDMGYLLN